MILKGVDHINRFVREISYFVIKAIFIASEKIYEEPTGEDVEDEKTKQQANLEQFKQFCEKLVPIVA